MEPEGHLGRGQLVAVAFSLVVADAFIFLPTMFAKRGYQAAWLLALLTAVGAAVTLIPLVLLMRTRPGLSLPSILEEALGPWVGILLNLVLLAYFFGVTAVALRGFVETFEAALLPAMPPSLLVIIAILVMAYGSYLGTEPLARTASVLMPLTLLVLAVGLLLTAPRWNFNLLWPLAGPGFPNLVGESVGLSLVYGDLLVFGLYLTAGRDFGAAVSGAAAGFVLGTVALAAVAAGEVLLFGPQISSQFPFTALSVERMVYFGRFIQRVESVFVLFWCFAALSKLCLLFHAVTRTLTYTLRLPTHRAIIPALAAHVAIFALLPENLRSVITLQSHWLPLWGIVPVVGIPLLGLVAVAVRRLLRPEAVLHER